MATSKARSILPAAREVQLAAQELQLTEAEATQRFSKGLPPGWTACCSEAGEVYYHQAAWGVSQWSHPGHPAPTGQERLQPLVMNMMKRLKVKDGEKAGESESEKGRTMHSIYDARSRHVPLETPQSLFSDALPSSVRREDLTGRAFALHGILAPAEAASYCRSASAVGFAASDVRREFPEALRNNARLVHFSEALAAAVYRRLLPQLCHRDIFLLQPMGFGAEGRWKPSGVNPCFRISRYLPGEHFAQHCDGMYTNDDGECSIYSLVLYLNDEFEGGELEFPNSSFQFKPSAGTAVLFPHDMPHAALEVLQGTKFVARSELMFRCVDRQRPPKEPKIAQDPLFQRMAALYEHIGDLVALGDVDATTKAYQEALGIQIAHHGTEVVKEVKHRRSLLEDKTWESIFSFLEPLEVSRATMSVSSKWHEIASSGTLWQRWFKQRWPWADEILEGETYQLDSELKDWVGLYRREHLLSSALTAVIFPAACLTAYDGPHGSMHGPMPAVCRHNDTGLGWDRSLKQRQGWTFGKNVFHARNYKTWEKDGEVDFEVLPELFAWSFSQFKLRPSEQHLVVPSLPGLLTRSAQERLANILHRRFQVPRLSFATAPLCALAAHNLKTGTVIWGCAFGTCSIFCFHEEEEVVADFGRWDFQKATAVEVAQQLQTAQKLLHPAIASSVLQHVVISCQPCVRVETEKQRYGSHAEVDDTLRDWANAEALAEQLSVLGLSPELHASEPNDVVTGARALAGRLPLAASPSEPQSWEWRAYAEGQWHRLSPYISAVFEGALRNDKEVSAVQLSGRLGLYLVANLEAFTITVAEPMNFRGWGINSFDDMEVLGAWCPLTRFLRGRPSTVPDRRKPEDLACSEELPEVQEVQGVPAWHVRTLAGKLVFSRRKDGPRMHLQDLLADCAKQLQTSQRRLQLLNGTSRTHCDDELQEALAVEDSVELLILVGPEPPAERPSEPINEQIPEDLPGEMAGRCDLQRALLTALHQQRH